MSATRGMWMRCLICLSASAAWRSGTATRTISHPAASRAWICATVASTSRVSVVVMDCTAMGAPPPTGTFPMYTRRVRVLSIATPPQGCLRRHAPLGKGDSHVVEHVLHGQVKDQAEQERLPHQVDVALAPGVHRTAPQPLRHQEGGPPPVEGRQGEQVEQADDDAEEGREVEEGLPPRPRGGAQDVHRGVGP